MIPIKGLFEAHISVRHFDRSVAFYRDVLGLELGVAQPERPAAFFWIGGGGRGLIGGLSPGGRPLPRKRHPLSVAVELKGVLAGRQRRRSAAVYPPGVREEL